MPSPEAHPGLAAAERLRRVAAALAAGTAPPPEDSRWLARRLQSYLSAPTDLVLDTVLQLAPPPGGSSWRSVAKHAERDRLLRELAASMDGTAHARATDLQQRLRRYAGTSWPRDRRSGAPTAANTILFRIYTLDPDPPTGIRRLTDIIT
jgi:hypothetical protein